MPGSQKDAAPRAHRFAAGLPAVLRVGGREFSCTAENFSRTGLLLVCVEPCPAAEGELLLRAASGDLEVPIRVRVVRLQDTSEGGHRVAVEFLEQDPKNKEGIEFLLQRVIEGHAIAPSLEEIPPGTPPHEVRKILEAVSLPHRVSLAAKAGPREREILLHDHNPQVLESLARNPGLLVHEARQIAVSQHVLPSTLAILVEDGRWSADEEMKVRIVSHPRVLVPLAERLSGTMSANALRRAVQRPGLSGHVRQILLRRISRSAGSR